MNSLPDDILRHMLQSLPLVDAFCLRRVNSLFDRHLLLSLTTLELNYADIENQCMERNIMKTHFADVVESILTGYGQSVKRLQIYYHHISMFRHKVVFGCCPNVEEIELRETFRMLPHPQNFVSVHFSDLIILSKLRKFKAELCLANCSSTEANVIVQQLSRMEEVASVRLEVDDVWFLHLASQIPGLKEVHYDNSVLENIENDRAEVNWTGLYNLEGVRFTFVTHPPALHLLPENLITLYLQFDTANVRAHRMTPMDLTAANCLLNLTEITLRDIVVSSYEFLGACVRLESIDLIRCAPQFDIVALSHIPMSVALHHIGIDFGHQLDAPLLLFDEMRQRNWPLRSIRFGGVFSSDVNCSKSLVRLLRHFAAGLQSICLYLRCRHGLNEDVLKLTGDVNMFPLLSRLNIERCTKITFNGLRRLMERRAALVNPQGRGFSRNLEKWGMKRGKKRLYLERELPVLYLTVPFRHHDEYYKLRQLSKIANVILLDIIGFSILPRSAMIPVSPSMFKKFARKLNFGNGLNCKFNE